MGRPVFAVASAMSAGDEGRELFLGATGTAPPVSAATEIIDDIASDYIAQHNREVAEFAATEQRKKAALMERLAARKQRAAAKKRASQAAGARDPGDGLGPLPTRWNLIRMPDGKSLFQMPNGQTTFDDPRTDEIEDGSSPAVKNQQSVATLSEMMHISPTYAEAALTSHGWDMTATCMAVMQEQTKQALDATEQRHQAELANIHAKAEARRAAAPRAPSPFVTLRAKLPAGIRGGMYFPVSLPDGRRLRVAVPPGVPPNGIVQFKVKRLLPGERAAAPQPSVASDSTMLTVKVPPGVRPGQRMNVAYNG